MLNVKRGEEIMENKKNKVKLLLFFGMIVVILLFNHFFGWSKYMGNARMITYLKEVLRNNFWLAIVSYTILTMVGCVVLALPGITFAVIAGMLFGPVLGTLACLFATTLGAMLAFLVARFFIKDAVKPMLEKNKRLKKMLLSDNEKSDMILLMITRMVPIFPYNLQNFAYGITNIKFIRYSIGTFIFMFPGVSFFTIGAAGLTAQKDKWKYFFIAGILAVMVTGVGVMIQKRFLKDI